jgi:signal peptidase I
VTTPETGAAATRTPALGCLLEIVQTLVLTLLIFWLIQTFVAQPYRVEMHSMERTLEPDEYVLVDKLTPRFDRYKRGDIVVFQPPSTWVTSLSNDGQPYIKRVIGVGGDSIQIHDGDVFVDGVKLDEPYVFTDNGVRQTTEALSGPGEWVIPDGELFLMGDHRAESSDSRVGGPVRIDSVIGRAWLRYWPIQTFEIIPTPRHPELASAAP